MSEIRVTSVVGENGGDRVGLTTGLTVGPLTGTTGIGATITHQGHAQFAGVCTATSSSFVGNGANLTGVILKNYQIKSGTRTSISAHIWCFLPQVVKFFESNERHLFCNSYPFLEIVGTSYL